MDPEQAQFSSLEKLCLSKLRNDLDQFPTSYLGLLPLHLRRSLLCGLPAADICKLEESKVLDGIDLDSVWQNLVECFVNLLFRRTPSWSVDIDAYYGPYLQPKLLLPSAKDNFIAMISKLLFLTKTCNRCWESYEYFNCGKSKLIAGLLFGFYSLETNNKCITISTSGNSLIHVPQRYANHLNEIEDDNITKLISSVMKVFNQGPKAIHFCVDEQIDDELSSVDDQILMSFLSQVEEFGAYFLACIRDANPDWEPYCSLLRNIVSSPLYNKNPQSACCLQSLSFEGVHTSHKLILDNLRDSSLLSYSSQHCGCDWNDTDQDTSTPYTKLKKIKLVVSTRDYELVEGSIECALDQCSNTIAAILYSQSELEEVTLTELFSILPINRTYGTDVYVEYKGFEKLYFSLPWIVSRPSFKSLTLDACSMPLNAAQNIIHTFLCTPTTHAQSLDLSSCTLYDTQPLSLPEGCPEYPTFSETSPCVDANLKSLSLFVNNGLSNYSWLLSHPNMKFKHLELFCNPTTKDKPTIDFVESDESEIDYDSGDEESGIKRPKLSIEEDYSQLNYGIQRLCDFICSLEQPEKLDVHIITADALSSSEKEAVERVRKLPTLSSLSFCDRHWSLTFGQ